MLFSSGGYSSGSSLMNVTFSTYIAFSSFNGKYQISNTDINSSSENTHSSYFLLKYIFTGGIGLYVVSRIL
jgi:hypothetical protein